MASKSVLPPQSAQCTSLSRPYHFWATTLVGVIVMATAMRAHAQTYTLTTPVTFNYNNGAYPVSTLALDGSGNLYGATSSGGSIGYGSIFKIASGTSALTTLVSFNFNDGNGSGPSSLISDSSGNLYGTTGGGSSKDGTVFKIAAGTSTVTTLATFTGDNGAGPGSLTLDSGGNLYGVTSSGGSGNDGTAFKIAAGTNTITTIATFTGVAAPQNLIRDGSGNLYGTTVGLTGSSSGTVFKIAAGTSTISTLATFTGSNGSVPYGGLVIDSSGNLYGTANQGGTSNDGTIYKIAAGTNALTILATFTGTANGRNPYGGLILDSSGNLYGTTQQGGSSDYGTAFRLSTGTGTLTTLATFNGAGNGRNPMTSLAFDSGGNLYGTTYRGGANDFGTVFKLTLNSSATPEPAALALLLPALPLFVRRAHCRSVKARQS